MSTSLGSIRLASTDPDRLRAWYAEVFDAVPDRDGFLQLGGVAVLIDGRDDVAGRNPEPDRVILNFHVDEPRLRPAGWPPPAPRSPSSPSGVARRGSPPRSTPTATRCRSSS